MFTALTGIDPRRDQACLLALAWTLALVQTQQVVDLAAVADLIDQALAKFPAKKQRLRPEEGATPVPLGPELREALKSILDMAKGCETAILTIAAAAQWLQRARTLVLEQGLGSRSRGRRRDLIARAFSTAMVHLWPQHQENRPRLTWRHVALLAAAYGLRKPDKRLSAWGRFWDRTVREARKLRPEDTVPEAAILRVGHQ
jgi:hypothetical protein